MENTIAVQPVPMGIRKGMVIADIKVATVSTQPQG
jgi:hypothetical protein